MAILNDSALEFRVKLNSKRKSNSIKEYSKERQPNKSRTILCHIESMLSYF